MSTGALTNLKGMVMDGAAEKAILYIYRKDINASGDVTKEDVEKLQKMEKDLESKTRETLSFKGAMKDFKDSIKPGAGSMQNVGVVDSDNGEFLKFTVQYNPSTIRLSTVSGNLQERISEPNRVTKLNNMHFTGKTTLSFDLVFDDCDNMNAFMFNEIANINVSGALNKGKSLLTNGGNVHSVRKRMDAIMSLLSTPSTQQVIFYWSKMVFRGTVTSVSNNFTMFNPQGNPIRGTMSLQLTQDKEVMRLKYDDAYWNKSFEKCFKKPNGKGVSKAGGRSKLDKISNNPFLNI